MSVRVHVCITQADADTARREWEKLGYKLVDVGASPTGVQYFETKDITQPLHDHASRYVVVMSDGV